MGEIAKRVEQTLTFPHPKWEVDDPIDYPGRARASPSDAHHNIGASPVHVVAYRVCNDKRRGQIAWQADFQDEVEAVQTLCGDGAVEPYELEGLSGEWIVAAFGYGI